jgi:ribosomal protein L40E
MIASFVFAFYRCVRCGTQTPVKPHRCAKCGGKSFRAWVK